MLIAELVFALATLPFLIASVVTALVNAAVAAVALATELTIRLLGLAVRQRQGAAEATRENRSIETGDAKRPEVAGPIIHPAVLRWSRRLGVIAAVLLGLLMAGVFVLNTFFFQATATWLFRAAASRADMQFSFAQVSGNLFAGRFEITELQLARPEHPEFTFEVRADRLAIDLDLLTLAQRDRRVRAAEAAGLHGQVDRLDSPIATRESPWTARRTVRIEHLHLRDVDLVLTDYTATRPRALHLQMDALDSKPMRSQWAWFDLLFSTNGQGWVNGAGFEITNVRSADGNRTEWAFADLPAEAAGVLIGGPFNWLEAGLVDIDVSNRWTEPGESVEMDWAFTLREPHARAPDDWPGLSGRIAAVAVNYINGHEEELLLSFGIRLDSSGFRGSASPEAAGLWSNIHEALVQHFADATAAEVREGGVQRLLERIRPQADD